MKQKPRTVFKPVHSQRTADTIVDRLESRILDGTFAVGELLPSEEQLALQFAVGRRAVREALKVLEARGLVEVRMGVGTTVKRNDLDSFLKVLARNIATYYRIDRADVYHVAELRELIELAALQRLAADPDKAAIAKLESLIDKQKQAQAADDYHGYQDWHFMFHHEIVDALHNPLISMLYKQVMALMRAPMEQTGSVPEIVATSIADHERIVAALSNGRTDEIQALLAKHLQESIANIERVVGESAIVESSD